MFKNPGTKWPIIISAGIIGVIALSTSTVMFAMKHPVEVSDYGLQKYQDYDKNANDIINAQIEFDKVYDINLITTKLDANSAVLEYAIHTKDGSSVDNAKIEAVFTRPESAKDSMHTDVQSMGDGIYKTKPIKLSREGRWDILAKIEIDGYSRFYNIKSDTRKELHQEF